MPVEFYGHIEVVWYFVKYSLSTRNNNTSDDEKAEDEAKEAAREE